MSCINENCHGIMTVNILFFENINYYYLECPVCNSKLYKYNSFEDAKMALEKIISNRNELKWRNPEFELPPNGINVILQVGKDQIIFGCYYEKYKSFFSNSEKIKVQYWRFRPKTK